MAHDDRKTASWTSSRPPRTSPRHSIPAALAVATLSLALLGMAPPAAQGASKQRPAAGAQARQALAVARATMRGERLRAVILEVRVGRRVLLRRALGNSMTGVPATPRMHFRNGNVAIAYLTTILLQLRDEGVLSLDDPLARWLPNLPEAGRVTLRMLAGSTSGYSDYVRRDEFASAFYANPFRRWTARGLIALGTSRIEFSPGTSFDYSHTGFTILGEVLRKATGKPVARLIRERILSPLRLRNTRSSQLAGIPAPVLHAYTGERDLYEESTFWSPSWGTARGANMTSDIADVATSAAAIGSGALLSRRSHRAQLAPATAGLGGTSRKAFYAMGLPVMGGWTILSPSLAGFGVMAAHLPARRLTIAAVSTRRAGAADANHSEELVRRIASRLAPRRPIPRRP